ncbi:class I SAM-dependent methyltransferase, partial [Micrococcus endophyticus]
MTATPELPDFVPASNQGGDPAVYEVENAALDREGTLWAALQEAAPWVGRTLLDLGAGTGF